MEAKASPPKPGLKHLVTRSIIRINNTFHNTLHSLNVSEGKLQEVEDLVISKYNFPDGTIARYKTDNIYIITPKFNFDEFKDFVESSEYLTYKDLTKDKININITREIEGETEIKSIFANIQNEEEISFTKSSGDISSEIQDKKLVVLSYFFDNKRRDGNGADNLDRYIEENYIPDVNTQNQ